MDQQQPHDEQHGQRSIAVIRDELAELQRHLVEVPPHHGGGRADLEARADALRRELARAEAAAATRSQQQQAQQQ